MYFYFKIPNESPDFASRWNIVDACKDFFAKKWAGINEAETEFIAWWQDIEGVPGLAAFTAMMEAAYTYTEFGTFE